jgi:hypothetical protein
MENLHAWLLKLLIRVYKHGHAISFLPSRTTEYTCALQEIPESRSLHHMCGVMMLFAWWKQHDAVVFTGFVGSLLHRKLQVTR